MRIFRTCITIAALLLPVRGQDAATAVSSAKWQPVFQGVEKAEISATAPRLLRAVLLRVKLDTPGVLPVVTPENGAKPGETDSARTSTFLSGEKCQAAVNAAPFDKVFSTEGKPQDIHGLHIRDGKQISAADGRPALFFRQDGAAGISRAPFPPDMRQAVGGFEIILKEGANVAGDRKLHPRTGAGVSQDGKTLWLIAVDGRQKDWSGGCTTVEMADWLKAAGAWSGINLDGGGTTALVVEKDGKPAVLNRPIHLGIPGLERPGGSHLGIRALPLQEAR